MWALIIDNTVTDVTTIDPKNRFQSSLNWVPAPSNVEPGWTYENEKFSPPNSEEWSNLESTYRPDIALSTVPFNNLIEGGGRFSDQSGYSIAQYVKSGPFRNALLFLPANGMVVTEGGKFIYNNNNFGGTSGVMSQAVVDLLTAIGRVSEVSGGRYGIEFYIARFAAGNGTVYPLVVNGKVYNLMTVNDSMHLTSCSGYYTFSAWIRVVKGELAFSKRKSIYIDGVAQSSNPVIYEGSGWKFVEITNYSSVGYDNAFPGLYGESSKTVIELAMPAVFSGIVYPGRYTAPVCSAIAY